jgi:hypothetical protein
VVLAISKQRARDDHHTCLVQQPIAEIVNITFEQPRECD